MVLTRRKTRTINRLMDNILEVEFHLIPDATLDMLHYIKDNYNDVNHISELKDVCIHMFNEYISYGINTDTDRIIYTILKELIQKFERESYFLDFIIFD